jgi:hypothetical protein
MVLRVIAVAYALVTALASFGLPSLLTSWFTSGEELPLRTAYVVWGVLAGLLIPGLALSLLARSRIAIWRALAAVVAGTAIAMALAFEPENLSYAALIVGPAVLLLVLHPQARDALRPAGVDRLAVGTAAIMAIPAAWYGLDLAARSRASSYLDTMHGQYAQGAVLTFSLLLMSFVGALRQDGRRVVVALVSVSAAILGLAGIAFPDDPMSPGVAGGVVTLVAAGAYAFAGLRSGQRPR